MAWTRRRWLAALVSSMCSRVRGFAEEPPRNIAGSLAIVDGTLTPANLFFVREHFAQPVLSLASWGLRVEGHVDAPFELSFGDLLLETSVKREFLLECAGNGPAGYAVSNGLWEGVRLPDLLARAKPRNGAAEVLLEGADTGKLHSASAGFPYARTVPLEKCREAESLIAFKLNGRFLPRRNGFPARAVLAGWYGMDWVKWLRRIVVLAPNERPPAFYESGMTEAYIRLLQMPDGAQRAERISELKVKSEIAEPTNNTRLSAGLKVIRGFAWTGTGRISSVEVSVNGGTVWAPATLDMPPRPQTWVPWSYRWRAEPGNFALMSRASDDQRRQQPLSADARRKDSYELNHCASINCRVV